MSEGSTVDLRASSNAGELMGMLSTVLEPPEDRPAVPASATLSLPDRPIFISGCNRGGTTIFSRLLGAHPDVNNIGTGPFYEGMHVWRAHFPDFSRHRWAAEPWRSRFRRQWENPKPLVVEDLLRRFRELDDGRRLLEKTPSNAIRVEFIDRLFPDSLFLHVLRDGRDTVASLMARGVRLKYAGRQWVGAHRSAFAAFQRLPPERVVIARYEDLLREPVQTLLTISERLQLSIGPEVRITIEVAAGEMIEGTERRWTQLSGKQKRFALDEIAEMQAELGYPVAE